MIPQSLIKYALGVVLAVAAVGQLPRFTQAIRVETIKLLKESQSSNWGKVWIPESASKKRPIRRKS